MSAWALSPPSPSPPQKQSEKMFNLIMIWTQWTALIAYCSGSRLRLSLVFRFLCFLPALCVTCIASSRTGCGLSLLASVVDIFWSPLAPPSTIVLYVKFSNNTRSLKVQLGPDTVRCAVDIHPFFEFHAAPSVRVPMPSLVVKFELSERALAV